METSPTNPFSPKYDAEFHANRFLRTRIHGILFLNDKSTMQCPLDADYEGALVLNPHLTLEAPQETAINKLGCALTGLVKNWLCGSGLAE